MKYDRTVKAGGLCEDNPLDIFKFMLKKTCKDADWYM
jgi:hypothetical protein